MRFGKIAPNRYFDKMGMYIPARIDGTIEIAGQKFNSVEIYADHRKEVQEADGAAAYLVTGNALFWNKTVIIDFRNKTFGVK